MFTGLIDGTGTVSAMNLSNHQGGRISISYSFSAPLSKGESIAINGICLTVVAITSTGFEADVSPETLMRTNLSRLKVGSQVNLERALCVGDRLGGHIVLGHIDGVGNLSGVTDMGNFRQVSIELPQGLSRYVVEKGSIAVDGISLTVAGINGHVFQVAVIPETWEQTNLKGHKPGDTVNIEVDILAKHVEKLLQGGKSEITLETLSSHGFV
jgi:riboflavin synthase